MARRGTSAPASTPEPATLMGSDAPDDKLKSVDVKGKDAPVKVIKAADLKLLGQKLNDLFSQYRSDRVIVEQRWLRNQRQYLGVYDPEVEASLEKNMSRAYPRITRVKCLSFLSRIMNLMFPGNEKNWSLQASPSPSLSKVDVKQAVAEAQQRDSKDGQQPPPIDIPYVMAAVQRFADKQAAELEVLIDDQLQELGGDQTYDFVQLNRRVLQSGIMYGPGLLRGPYMKTSKQAEWSIGADGEPSVEIKTIYKPMYEFLSVWDFYPDMSAKTLDTMDGYFTRSVMSRHQVRNLAKRPDFFGDVIKDYLKGIGQKGNFRAQNFETELRSMGVKVNVNEQKTETTKYEVLVWHGAVSGDMLALCGVDVPRDKLADDMDAEVWMIDGTVIKVALNPWVELGMDVKTLHGFIFDEDDTSPVGAGLPNVMRDSQMAVCAMARMYLDNASVICGPNLEVNTALMRPDQDLSGAAPHKTWYRDDDGPSSQWPAVRNIEIEGHLQELMQGIKLFMDFADTETFVNPANGGDMAKMPSEPMRTAAGASMLKGDAALPFKDVVRNFDSFTQSVIESLVAFNKQYRPDVAEDGDFNVIARGATSLIAKEVRGMQIDMLATTMTPEEKVRVDMDKFTKARFAVRDLTDMLLPPDEVQRALAAQAQQQEQMQQQAQELAAAQLQEIMSTVFKNMAQGQKNAANADATKVKAALEVLEQGLATTIAQMTGDPNAIGSQAAQGRDRPAGQAALQPPRGTGGGNVPAVAGALAG